MKNTDPFKKLDELYKLTESTFSDMNWDRFRALIRHTGRAWVNDRKTPLTSEEKAFADLLIRNNIRPPTARRWLLFSNMPPDIQQHLKEGRYGQRLAMRECKERRRPNKKIEANVREDILKFLQSLQKQDKSNTIEVSLYA